MELRIYNEVPAPRRPQPIVFRLSMSSTDRGVVVAAVDEYGDPLADGKLVRFNKDGTIKLFHTINPSLGLKLDADGRQVVRNKLPRS